MGESGSTESYVLTLLDLTSLFNSTFVARALMVYKNIQLKTNRQTNQTNALVQKRGECAGDISTADRVTLVKAW